MGGERGEIAFTHVYPAEIAEAPAHWHNDTAMLTGAAVRAVQMTGALETVLDLSVRHAGERVAFGRPIAKFQAVQHNLARLAGEVAAALAASGSAAETLHSAAGFDQSPFEFGDVDLGDLATGGADDEVQARERGVAEVGGIDVDLAVQGLGQDVLELDP